MSRISSKSGSKGIPFLVYFLAFLIIARATCLGTLNRF